MHVYDEELPRGFQDADIEQAQMEQVGRQIDAARAKGICTHGGVTGYRRPAVYPIQNGLNPGEQACNESPGECFVIFRDEDDWAQAMDDARNGQARVPTAEMMCVHFGGMCFTCGFGRDPHMTADDAEKAHKRFDPAHEPHWEPDTDKEFTKR